MKQLSDKQKCEICKLARIVWDTRLSGETKAALAAQFGSATAAFNAWRHEQQTRAVGKESLVESADADFCALMAHFYLLLGNNLKAGTWIMRGATDAKRKILYLILTNCVRAALGYPSYPNAICRAQFKCNLWQASHGQLVCILSTVRNRISSRSKREAAASLN